MAGIDTVRQTLTSGGIKIVTPDAGYATQRAGNYTLALQNTSQESYTLTHYREVQVWEISTSVAGLRDSTPLYDAAERLIQILAPLIVRGPILPESMSVSYEYAGVDDVGQAEPASYMRLDFALSELRAYA